MERREEIKKLAMVVKEGLTTYVAVHNVIFHEAATFNSLLKNLFGMGVPMAKLLEDSERLLPLWNAIHQKIEAFRVSAYSSLSTDEKYYLDILKRYVDAVQKTVAALVDRQRFLVEVSKERQKDPMEWETFQQKEEIYKMAVQEYLVIGKELNAAAPIIF